MNINISQVQKKLGEKRRLHGYLIHHRGHISTNAIIIQKAIDASNRCNSNLQKKCYSMYVKIKIKKNSHPCPTGIFEQHA